MTTPTYEIRLSSRFTFEHSETSRLPGEVVDWNRRGMLMRLTLAELHELWSRADNYADPYYGRDLVESGLADLHRSAKKVIEQLGRADLLKLAQSREARDAYDAATDALAS